MYWIKLIKCQYVGPWALGHTGKWNRTEGPQINAYIYEQQFMTKDQRTFNGEKTICLINGVGKTGQPHAKERN